MFQMLAAKKLRCRAAVFDSGPLPSCEFAAALYVRHHVLPASLDRAVFLHDAIASTFRVYWEQTASEKGDVPERDVFVQTLVFAPKRCLILHGVDPLLAPLNECLHRVGAMHDMRVSVVADFKGKHVALLKTEPERYAREVMSFLRNGE